MRKFATVLAAAALFELAAVVASSHAAPVGGYFITPVGPAGVSAASCAVNGGVLVHKANGEFCQTRAPARTGTVLLPGANAATKAPAKKEEAKKE